MQPYYLEVVIETTEGELCFETMKGKNANLENIKDVASLISNGGYLKKVESALDTTPDSFVFYPASKISRININPDTILTTG